MRIILIIGAGRSASSLIQYLWVNLKRGFTSRYRWFIIALAQNKTENHPNANYSFRYFWCQSKKRSDRKADIVISMLPAHLHIVARDCVVYKRAWSPSYVSDAMQELDEAVKRTIWFSWMKWIGSRCWSHECHESYWWNKW
jgi:hypothetical protein